MGLRLPLIASLALLSTAPAWADTRITGQPYVRQDGGSDAVITTCSSNDPVNGGSKLRQNEPAIAIKPDEPDFIVASANDSCVFPLTHDGWQGVYVSADGGAQWTNSLLPGYPGDTSAAGQASPLFGLDPATSDPLLAWDHVGNLFVGGVAFNRTVPTGSSFKGNGNAFVATYSRDPSSSLGIAYKRMVIVGEGTPSRFPNGRFSDKPSLRVDNWSGSPNQGNVYVAWSLFTSVPSRIRFARSLDHGQTFSTPATVSGNSGSAQGSAIAVTADGSVYVFWRQFATHANAGDAVVYAKSIDGGQTFGAPHMIRTIIPYDRSDVLVSGGAAVNCGDGSFACLSGFTFHRTTSFPDAIADALGNLYVAWEQVTPVADNGDTYHPDGQSQVVIVKSTNGGTTWSAPSPPDPQPIGHQFFPRLAFDEASESLAVIYYDSREDASYSPFRPPGNRADGTSVCQRAKGLPSSSCDVLNAFIATSRDGGVTWASTKVSSVGHQPEYEVAGDGRVPFHGDYLGVDAVAAKVYGAWTDNRDVVPGTDPRDATPDGFDVHQCRTQQPGGSFSADECPNAGGRDLNIFGAALTLP